MLNLITPQVRYDAERMTQHGNDMAADEDGIIELAAICDELANAVTELAELVSS